MTEKWEGPQTESTEKRGQEVGEDGVVVGIAWTGIVAGACGVIAAIVTLLVYFF